MKTGCANMIPAVKRAERSVLGIAFAFIGAILFSSTLSAATLTHRWSFNTDYKDSVTDTEASPIGAYYELVDGQLVLTGSGEGTGSMNLGYNKVDTSEATIEIWATQNEIQSWSRIFDYGTDTGNYICMAWTYGTEYYHDKVVATIGSTEAGQEYALGPHMLGVKYHFSVTIKANTGDSTTTVRFMRRNSITGALEKDWTLTASGLYSDLSNPSFYLGKSQFNDRDARASYDEVRTWSGILTDDQLEANVVRGPDDTTPGELLSGPAYATWVGTTAPESADDLESSANWTCTDASGNTVADAVPGTATTVIIPVSDASYFTIPTGYTPNWRAVRFGPEYAATQWGKIVYSGERYLNSNIPPDQSWIDIAHNSYTSQGTTSDPSGCLANDAMNNSQFRFDGWFYVDSDKAGVWTVKIGVDDYMSLLIDGAMAGYSFNWYTWFTHYHYVSAGWHRFTLIVGDTNGGQETTLKNNTRSLITMGDSENTTITFGDLLGNDCAQAGTIKLAADCNWAALGTLTLTSGITIDLNGHSLIIDDVTSDYFGTQIINSSESSATLYYNVDPAASVGLNDITIASNISKFKTASYVWTGAAGDGKTSTLENWVLLNGSVPTEAPVAGTPLTFSAEAGGIVTNDVEGLGGDLISFTSGAGAFTIVGNKFSDITSVENSSEFVQTFSNEVSFAGTYQVTLASKAVNFAGGATASEPDSSLRYAGSSDLSRTLVGNFNFTNETWNIPDLGNNDYPWIVANGTTVTANNIIGQQTYATRILQIEEGGSLYADTLAMGWDRGDVSVNGYVEVAGTLTINVRGSSSGEYHAHLGREGNTGTVKARKMIRVGHNVLSSYAPNLIVGSDGIGNQDKDWSWYISTATTITASDDFSTISGGSNGSDWGFTLNANLTFNVPAEKTVTFGTAAKGDAGIVKEGEGTLVMTNYYGTYYSEKNYSGGTTVNGGLLRFAATGNIGAGATTVNDGGTLELASGVWIDKTVNVNSNGVFTTEAGADVTYATVNLAAGATMEIGGTNLVYGTINVPSEGTYKATVTPVGAFDIGVYKIANNFSGNVSLLKLDTSKMTTRNSYAKLKTTTAEGERTQLVLGVYEGGYYIYFR